MWNPGCERYSAASAPTTCTSYLWMERSEPNTVQQTVQSSFRHISGRLKGCAEGRTWMTLSHACDRIADAGQSERLLTKRGILSRLGSEPAAGADSHQGSSPLRSQECARRSPL